MECLTSTVRPNWQRRVEEHGLVIHTTDDGKPFWDESVYFAFSAAEIDTLEAATYALDKLCLQAVEHIISHGRFEEFEVPPGFIPWLIRSWEVDEQTIFGRFDLLYDGTGPPKLIEFNADTPTALLEAAVVQWYWLKDVVPEADQFNSLHERLIETWKAFYKVRPNPVTFASVAGHVEDYVTVNYLRDVAVQAGIPTQYLTMQQIGWNARRQAFLDLKEREIACVFKLYPWEWLFGEQFGPHLVAARTRWLEPVWKVLLSNKALLPLLWELFPGHPNLLPASSRPLQERQVCKPTRGREGANIAIMDGTTVEFETPGPYAEEPCIYQQFHPTQQFDGRSVVLGSWLVGGYACGIGIRADDGPITTNTSRFVPHLFR